VPLSKYTSSFPDPAKLHPFDAALLQLTVNTGMYKWVTGALAKRVQRCCDQQLLTLPCFAGLTRLRSTLSKVSSLRKSLQEVGKAYANRAANAPNKAVSAA
jgi:hypothetical protein